MSNIQLERNRLNFKKITFRLVLNDSGSGDDLFLNNNYILELYVNPNSIQYGNKKIIHREKTRGGWAEFHWGDDLEVMSVSGGSGGFVDKNYGYVGNLENGQGRQQTVAYQNIEDLFGLYRNNGCKYDRTGLIYQVGKVCMTYENRYIAYGFFDSLDKKEDANKPFQFLYDYSFVITKRIHLWTRSIGQRIFKQGGPTKVLPSSIVDSMTRDKDTIVSESFTTATDASQKDVDVSLASTASRTDSNTQGSVDGKTYNGGAFVNGVAEGKYSASWYGWKTDAEKQKAINDQKLNPNVASGKAFDPVHEDGVASWDVPLGSVIKVTNLANNKSINVTVTDRGPAKSLYNSDPEFPGYKRILDLYAKPMNYLTDGKYGNIKIKAELISVPGKAGDTNNPTSGVPVVDPGTNKTKIIPASRLVVDSRKFDYPIDGAVMQVDPSGKMTFSVSKEHKSVNIRPIQTGFVTNQGTRLLILNHTDITSTNKGVLTALYTSDGKNNFKNYPVKTTPQVNTLRGTEIISVNEVKGGIVQDFSIVLHLNGQVVKDPMKYFK